ncbi:unnamed protein product [Zymoseptoria tritici ST99CH_1E4]|nr:unnamed protein product [Zymoseptoria tritici ST99CH_1E4]
MPERSMASLQAAADRLGFRRKRKPTLPWSAEEIQRLDLRMEQNPSSLPSELEVATLFPGRTSPAVRHRWYQGRHTKRTGYVHKAGASPWTREEDQVVLQGLAKGSSLMTIAALLPNRTQKAHTCTRLFRSSFDKPGVPLRTSGYPTIVFPLQPQSSCRRSILDNLRAIGLDAILFIQDIWPKHQLPVFIATPLDCRSETFVLRFHSSFVCLAAFLMQLHSVMLYPTTQPHDALRPISPSLHPAMSFITLYSPALITHARSPRRYNIYPRIASQALLAYLKEQSACPRRIMSAPACTSCQDVLHCNDSPLSITANIIGTLTFVAAIVISFQLYLKLIKDAPQGMMEKLDELRTLGDEGQYLFDKLARRQTQLRELDGPLRDRVETALKRTEGAFRDAMKMVLPPDVLYGPKSTRQKLWHRARYALSSDEIGKRVEKAALAMATLKEVAKDALPDGAPDLETTFRKAVSQQLSDIKAELKMAHLAALTSKQPASQVARNKTTRPPAVKRATF